MFCHFYFKFTIKRQTECLPLWRAGQGRGWGGMGGQGVHCGNGDRTGPTLQGMRGHELPAEQGEGQSAPWDLEDVVAQLCLRWSRRVPLTVSLCPRRVRTPAPLVQRDLPASTEILLSNEQKGSIFSVHLWSDLKLLSIWGIIKLPPF